MLGLKNATVNPGGMTFSRHSKIDLCILLAILQFNVATSQGLFAAMNVTPTVLRRRSTMMKLAFLASLLGSAAAFAPATKGGK